MLLKCQCLLVRSTIFGGLWSWLVVSTPLKNMKVSWDDYPIYDGKWNPCLEPPTRIPNLLLAKSSPVTGHCRSLSPRRPSDPRRCRTQQISHLRMEISGLQSGWCFLYSTPKAENWFKLSTILRQDSMCLFFWGVANIVYEFYDILCIPFTVIVGRYYCNWLQLYLGCKLNLVDCSFRTIKWQWWWGFIVFVIIIMIIIIIRYYPSKQPASLDLA